MNFSEGLRIVLKSVWYLLLTILVDHNLIFTLKSSAEMILKKFSEPFTDTIDLKSFLRYFCTTNKL